MQLNLRKREILKTMGISLWNARGDVPEFDKEIVEPVANSADGDVVEALQHSKYELPAETVTTESSIDWHLLQEQVKNCQACDLHLTRTNTVFGVGDPHTSWMIIGEAPGADEDLKGEPFVGKAGQLLNQMFLSIGLSREQVFIANILKCRPPNNRDPSLEEVVACQSFLEKQIAFIKPKIILAVGRVSAQNLLQTKETIGRIRGKVYHYRDTGIPLVATYHPAYLLRSPLEKRKVWRDLLLAQNVMLKTESEI